MPLKLHETCPVLYTSKEVADRFRVSPKWLQRNRQGKHRVKIDYIKLGGRIFYEESAITAALQRFKQVSVAS
ncbi:MAG: helix-turn-helix domain-containing protein [Pseudomonadota bacterium]